MMRQLNIRCFGCTCPLRGTYAVCAVISPSNFKKSGHRMLSTDMRLCVAQEACGTGLLYQRRYKELERAAANILKCVERNRQRGFPSNIRHFLRSAQ